MWQKSLTGRQLLISFSKDRKWTGLSRYKNAGKDELYRPISFISPVLKTLEALLLLSIREIFAVANHHHGIRPQDITTTTLHVIFIRASRGLNQTNPCHRTVAVALDLSKVFDTVNYGTLLEDVERSTLRSNIG